jgi:hypothetical protein
VDIAKSVNGVPIRLTDERWDHIVLRHEALAGLRDVVLAAIERPFAVMDGMDGELIASRRHEGWWVVVPYREVTEDDGFVITAFLSRMDPGEGRTIVWP